jgi:hypothetical protein
MPFIELVWPHLIKDAELISEVENKIPTIIELFKKAGALRGVRGFLFSEDGNDVKADFREILLLGKILNSSVPLYVL